MEKAYPASGIVVARLRPGDDVIESLVSIARERSIRAALVVGIGGLRRLEVGVFKEGKYDVETHEVREGETIELTSLLGSIAVGQDGSPSPHLHVTASLPDHRPVSGHLVKGVVGPLVELFIVVMDGELWRLQDSSIGLPALFASRRQT